jgi:hypothetical protein
MDSLSKQQLILIALLVSFVTSLATGITTVSLMDQSPNMTRTITQVIQQTVSGLSAGGASSTAAVAIAVNDEVADATASIEPSIVRLRDGDSGPIVGLGLIVSGSGAIMSDKDLSDTLNSPEAVFPNGTSVPIAVARFEINGDVAFLVPTRPISISMKPIVFGPSARLGASLWSLTGTSTYALSQGIVTELVPIISSEFSSIRTSITAPKMLPGTPLFDATGAVIGMATSHPADDSHGALFYPVQEVRNAVPK